MFVVSLITGLFFGCGPATVCCPATGDALRTAPAGVIAVNVDSVEAVLWSRSRANVGQEIFEADSPVAPIVAHGNSTTTVVVVGVISIREAPAFGVCPSYVLGCQESLAAFATFGNGFAFSLNSPWRRHGAFVSPTARFSGNNKAFAETSVVCPCSRTHRLTVNRQVPDISLVSSLSRVVSPPGVHWPIISDTLLAFTASVAAVYSKPIDAPPSGWALANVVEKISETGRPPLANHNASAAIIFPSFRIIAIKASCFHRAPRNVCAIHFVSASHSVDRAPFDDAFDVVAPATLGFSKSKLRTDNNRLFTTITQASPSALCCVGGTGVNLQDGQTVEFLPC